MKKLLVTLCALIMCLSSFAGDIKVIEGKASMTKREGLAEVIFLWDNAKYADRISLKEQWKDDYEKYRKDGEEFLIAGFNENAKKLSITTSEKEKANYSIEIEFENFDYFFSAMSVVPGHKHKVWAKIKITDKTSDKIVCVLKVIEFKGGRDLVKYDSYTEMMHDLGKELAVLK